MATVLIVFEVNDYLADVKQAMMAIGYHEKYHKVGAPERPYYLPETALLKIADDVTPEKALLDLQIVVNEINDRRERIRASRSKELFRSQTCCLNRAKAVAYTHSAEIPGEPPVKKPRKKILPRKADV